MAGLLKRIWFWLRFTASIGVSGYTIWWLFQHGHTLHAALFHWLNGANGPSLLVAFALLPLNLWLDVALWRCLLKPTQPSWKLAWEQAFAGYALLLPSPNRLGEYAGRLILVPATERLRAGTALFLSKLLMLVIVLSGALTAGSLLLNVQHNFAYRELIKVTACGLLSVCIILLISPRTIVRNLLRWPLPQAINNWLLHLSDALQAIRITRSELLALSVLRYTVFTVQFAALLYAAGVTGDPQLAILLSATILGFKSLLPSLMLYEIGMREAVTLSVLQVVGLPEAPGIAASLALYALNILLPAAMGAISLWLYKPKLVD
jgi:hypothetical protein